MSPVSVWASGHEQILEKIVWTVPVNNFWAEEFIHQRHTVPTNESRVDPGMADPKCGKIIRDHKEVHNKVYTILHLVELSP